MDFASGICLLLAAILSLNCSCNSSSVDGVPSEYELLRSNVSTSRYGFGCSTVQLVALLQQQYMECVRKLLKVQPAFFGK